MDHIPILKVDSFLLVSIQVELHDELAMSLQDDLTQKLLKTNSHGVLIDISALEIVDSYIGRMLSQISAIVGIMDATMVLVGMRPAVAITLVELGMTMAGVRTALNVDKGLALLRRSLDEPGRIVAAP
ncbi:STAS domain-containing protein [Ideonella azotifigens]|uniref:STAS domain-containing protein n=1 Tax=Ideonella azotifigens TaxID=513160 RepID=A0ABP3VVI0_9BURK|nr:STAS domain-containing protein [Ideonella azotifigens]MCD2339303.1 STAS domain-containing protein [Ideonella azotifigens]